MKFILSCLTILVLSIQTVNLVDVRASYKLAAQDKMQIDSFSDMMQGITKKDNVALVAYKGASLALQAKYAKTIKEKKEGFLNGVNYIEFSIAKKPNAIEPRFVRLSIQENAPKILKYRENIDEDKAFIIKQYRHISSKNLQLHIKDYILQSNLFSEEEKSIIR